MAGRAGGGGERGDHPGGPLPAERPAGAQGQPPRDISLANMRTVEIARLQCRLRAATVAIRLRLPAVLEVVPSLVWCWPSAHVLASLTVRFCVPVGARQEHRHRPGVPPPMRAPLQGECPLCTVQPPRRRDYISCAAALIAAVDRGCQTSASLPSRSSLTHTLAPAFVAPPALLNSLLFLEQPALRVLAERFLNRTIQGGDKGHDSVEDARATMELAQLKIQNGQRLISFRSPFVTC